jgi:hypothetical protein
MSGASKTGHETQHPSAKSKNERKKREAKLSLNDSRKKRKEKNGRKEGFFFFLKLRLGGYLSVLHHDLDGRAPKLSVVALYQVLF